jgi:trimethylamine--corrinoid protein Co-methyltransferase
MGFEKFILDADQASMAGRYANGVDISENGLALQPMLDSGPGQHFLGSPHTLANFENAFWRSQISDNNSFEQWEVEGGLDAARRANAVWKKRLADYEPPALDEAIDEELTDWISRRKAEFPDSNV